MSFFNNNREDAPNEAAKDEQLLFDFSKADSDKDDDIDPALISSIVEDETVAKKEAEPVKEPELSVADSQDDKKEDPLKDVKPDNDGLTVITKGTTINGSIVSDCSLDVMGTINGDIECLGKLTITGKVKGNSTAAEIFINTDRLEGDVVSEGCVKVGVKTIVIGNINATSAVFAGAVKGEIDIKGPVILDSTAIVKGNIKAKTIQINNGAVLEGFCSLVYADSKIDTIFS